MHVTRTTPAQRRGSESTSTDPQFQQNVASRPALRSGARASTRAGSAAAPDNLSQSEKLLALIRGNAGESSETDERGGREDRAVSPQAKPRSHSEERLQADVDAFRTTSRKKQQTMEESIFEKEAFDQHLESVGEFVLEQVKKYTAGSDKLSEDLQTQIEKTAQLSAELAKAEDDHRTQQAANERLSKDLNKSSNEIAEIRERGKARGIQRTRRIAELRKAVDDSMVETQRISQAGAAKRQQLKASMQDNVDRLQGRLETQIQNTRTARAQKRMEAERASHLQDQLGGRKESEAAHRANHLSIAGQNAKNIKELNQTRTELGAVKAREQKLSEENEALKARLRQLELRDSEQTGQVGQLRKERDELADKHDKEYRYSRYLAGIERGFREQLETLGDMVAEHDGSVLGNSKAILAQIRDNPWRKIRDSRPQFESIKGPNEDD